MEKKRKDCATIDFLIYIAQLEFISDLITLALSLRVSHHIIWACFSLYGHLCMQCQIVCDF